MKPKHALARLLMLSIILTALPATSAHIAIAQDKKDVADESTEDGLRFRLSEGSEKREPARPNHLAPTTSLSETETQNLLARLPGVKTEASDTLDFNLRERSLPPPRAGETIQSAFVPPASGAPASLPNTTAPLEVLRFAPEGDVD